MTTSKNHILRITVLFAIFLIAACASQPDISVEVLTDYNALFDHRAGWTGADGAYSVALAGDDILWLFGDTWYGEILNGRHQHSVIINNSIAIQRGLAPPDASIKFYAGQSPGGRPLAFVRPDDGRGWFWIYHGVQAGEGLYLFLVQLERTSDRKSFGFKIIGSRLMHVANPADSPDAWRWLQHRIPWGRFSAGGDTLFGSSLLKEDQFIYIFGTTEDVIGEMKRKFMILARAPETQLHQFDQWRFYSEGRWTTNFLESSRLCSDIANEYSVSYLPAIGKYIVVYTEKGFSRNIVFRLAPNPWGPWSEAEALYACPEAQWGPDIFCYAAKGHPVLSHAPDELIVTYVANSLDFERMAADSRLYRPRFLRVKFNIDR